MKYIVVDGSFRDSDGSLKGPGDTIELDEDMAKVHAGRVRPAPLGDAVAQEPDEKASEASAPSVQAPALAAVAGSDEVEH